MVRVDGLMSTLAFRDEVPHFLVTFLLSFILLRRGSASRPSCHELGTTLACRSEWIYKARNWQCAMCWSFYNYKGPGSTSNSPECVAKCTPFYSHSFLLALSLCKSTAMTLQAGRFLSGHLYNFQLEKPLTKCRSLFKARVLPKSTSFAPEWHVHL